MKATKKSYSIPGGVCTVFSPDRNSVQSIAVVEQDGRYPEKGFSINSKCTETIFVLKGKFKVTYGDKKFILKSEDVFYIEPGYKYSISGKGVNLVAVTPAWDKSQNTIVN